MTRQKAKAELEAAIAPTRSRAAPDELQTFWDNEMTPLADERAGAAHVLRARDSVRSTKATALSVEARKAQHAPRDRRICEAYAQGKAPKQIAADPKIRGRKKISTSQIRRILRASGP